MIKFFLELYLKNMTKSDLKSLADNNNIYFSNQEIDILFPIIKDDWRLYFDEVGKKELEEIVSKLTSKDCASRALTLINRIINS